MTLGTLVVFGILDMYINIFNNYLKSLATVARQFIYHSNHCLEMTQKHENWYSCYEWYVQFTDGKIEEITVIPSNGCWGINLSQQRLPTIVKQALNVANLCSMLVLVMTILHKSVKSLATVVKQCVTQPKGRKLIGQ